MSAPSTRQMLANATNANYSLPGGGSFTTTTNSEAPPGQPQSQWWSVLLGLLGFSTLLSTLNDNHIFGPFKLIVLGSLIEMSRRGFMWFYQRFSFKYSITARFEEGDPAYEWMVHFLSDEKVWKRSRDFLVSAKSSARKWAVDISEVGTAETINGHADFVPYYEQPHIFRWKGNFVEFRASGNVFDRSRSDGYAMSPAFREDFGFHNGKSISITMYTLHLPSLIALVEEARDKYLTVTRPHVIIHSAEHFSPGNVWASTKHKVRRPLESIILPEGLVSSLVDDANDFIRSESWYSKAGIPHRRGYLLHGPPGCGKTSTIYALAGELGVEIYSISLASGGIDDDFLNRAASSIPKNSIFLIEDIDCAFPSREDSDDESESIRSMGPPRYPMSPFGPFASRRRQRSEVSLSGLLNCLDGVASEEGKLFFATTNYVDRLDAALLRPGRIDRKIEYKLATPQQAEHLFTRVFTAGDSCRSDDGEIPVDESPSAGSEVSKMASAFAEQIPDGEFSTAELQGLLLSQRDNPQSAVEAVAGWVEAERQSRLEKQMRESERKQRLMKPPTTLVESSADGLEAGSTRSVSPSERQDVSA